MGFVDIYIIGWVWNKMDIEGDIKVVYGDKAAPDGGATPIIFVYGEERGDILLCWCLYGIILMEYRLLSWIVLVYNVIKQGKVIDQVKLNQYQQLGKKEEYCDIFWVRGWLWYDDSMYSYLMCWLCWTRLG